MSIKFDEEDKQRMLQLRKQGLTYPQIAERMGCDKKYVQKVVSKLLKASPTTF